MDLRAYTGRVAARAVMCRDRIRVVSRGLVFFFQAEDGIRDLTVTGVQTCALPISQLAGGPSAAPGSSARPRAACASVRARTRGARRGAVHAAKRRSRGIAAAGRGDRESVG